MLATSLFASAEPGVLQGGCGDTNRYHGVEDPHGCRQTGSFGIPREIANRVHAADWCFRRCDRLEGCNFISVSVSHSGTARGIGTAVLTDFSRIASSPISCLLPHGNAPQLPKPLRKRAAVWNRRADHTSEREC